MISSAFNTLIHQPLYNGLIFLIDTLHIVDVGIAVILFTIIVKLLLFPLSKTAVTTQLKMRVVEPELKELREKYKDDKQKQAQEMMRLYKENNINPFSSFLLIFIQLPIIIGLYWIFLKSGLPVVDTSLLYGFVSAPDFVIDMHFLGHLDLSMKSWLLAGTASVTSFFQMRYSLPAPGPKVENPSFKDDLARSMNLQMRYVFPVVIFFIAYTISGAVALYWATSNIFTIGQELVIRKRIKEPHEKAQKEKDALKDA